MLNSAIYPKGCAYLTAQRLGTSPVANDHSTAEEAKLPFHFLPCTLMFYVFLLIFTAKFPFQWLVLLLGWVCSVKQTLISQHIVNGKIKRTDSVILVPDVPTGGFGSVSKPHSPLPNPLTSPLLFGNINL